MWSLTSPRTKRISGLGKFRSSPKKDFFNTIRPIQTSDWQKHAADLETEMLKRGMFFEVIDWFEGQGKLPFGD
jgi:hypothetical protein